MTGFTNFVGGIAAVALLLAAGGAHAQEPTDAERCAGVTSNPDVAIQLCTKAIESGRYSGDDLARLHHSRGVEWTAKGDLDRAIADYDTALRLSPDSADVFYNRATAWANKGDPDRAIADYNAAIRLDPKEASAYGGRAVEWTVKGDYARAITDFDTALGLDPKSASAVLGRGRARFYSGNFKSAVSDFELAHKLDANAYTALWLHLARRRGGGQGDDALKPYATAAGDNTWPAPVISLYLGRTKPEAVVAASASPNPARQREQLCEANFYLAQWHLVRGERERALPLLKEAQDGCPKHFLEYEGALAELRRPQQR
jgi:lipoprotein NlpI